MIRCKKCGRYNDISEWPEDMRGEYTPELCHVCTRQESVTSADDAEEEPLETDQDPDGLLAQEEIDRDSDDEEEVSDEE